MTPRNVWTIAVVALCLATSGSVPIAAQEPITVTGCVERDAASSTPIFKIIVPQPKGSPVIYQLNAAGNPDVPGAAGKTAQISGPVSIEKRGGREIRVLTVKTFKIVTDRCG